jgi:hypothetical protein
MTILDDGLSRLIGYSSGLAVLTYGNRVTSYRRGL